MRNYSNYTFNKTIYYKNNNIVERIDFKFEKIDFLIEMIIKLKRIDFIFNIQINNDIILNLINYDIREIQSWKDNMKILYEKGFCKFTIEDDECFELIKKSNNLYIKNFNWEIKKDFKEYIFEDINLFTLNLDYVINLYEKILEKINNLKDLEIKKEILDLILFEE